MKSIDWEISLKDKQEVVSIKSSSKEGTRGEKKNDLWRQNEDLGVLLKEFEDINNRNILNPKVH